VTQRTKNLPSTTIADPWSRARAPRPNPDSTNVALDSR
jgi:hypothetical protein